MISRRSFIGALFAPAVVRVADLMPIKALAVEPIHDTLVQEKLLTFDALPPGFYNMVMTDLRWVEQRFLAEFIVKDPVANTERFVQHAFNMPPANPRIGSESKLHVLDYGCETTRAWVQRTPGETGVVLDIVTGRWASRA